MTKLRTLSLAASLAAATALISPAFAIDLGGGLGGAAGGLIGPSGIGGSISGTVNGTLDTPIPRTGRLDRLNERADSAIDQVQDRSVGAVKVPDQLDAAAVDAAVKAAGYGAAALETPLGSGSGSGSGDLSADGSLPEMPDTPELPDPAAAANGAVDQVQDARNGALKRAAATVPAEPVAATVSASGDASVSTRGASAEPGAEASTDDAAGPEAAAPEEERRAVADGTNPDY